MSKTSDSPPAAPLLQYCLRLADDALIHGQRMSEWCSRAPTLEEDIALANVALDTLGRARMLYQYAASQCGRSEDELAFLRDERQFSNLCMAELPCGDYAFTTLRQYLLDEMEVRYFEALGASTDEQLAAIAAKTLKECRYHLRRSGEWMLILGTGTGESRARMQRALDDIWAYHGELFAMDHLERELAEQGVAVDRAALESPWRAAVDATLGTCGLGAPEVAAVPRQGRQGIHTEHLGYMLAEMQFMQRRYPGLQW